MDDPAAGLRPEAVRQFWTWWTSAKDPVAAAIADRSLGSSPLVGEISAAVHGLHPELAWELGPGRHSMHNLTVTAEGNLALRRLSQQWLDSAPAPDQTWEYYASRQGGQPLGLEIAGMRFAPDDFRIAYKFDQSRERFDVVLFHPLFKKAGDNVMRNALFLTLDQCLGEDDVERWVGSVDGSKSPPSEGAGLQDFITAVAKARSTATGESFTLGQGSTADGKPVFIMVNTALKQIDHLEHIHHMAIAIALREPNANGLPHDEEAQRLNAVEDDLLGSLADNAVQIGRVTWGGRRELHFFVRDPAGAEAATSAWKERIKPWLASHAVYFDPAWTAAKSGIYAALAQRPNT